jgi:kumamolisin
MASRRRSRTALAGSARTIPRAAKSTGKSDPAQRIEVTVMIRPKASAATGAARGAALLANASRPPASRQYTTREAFAADRGADAADLAAVERFAHEHGLTVTSANVAERLVKLSGTLADLSSAFGATVKQYRLGKIAFRGRTGSLSLPPEVAESIVGVFGFDTRPAARPRYRALGAAAGAKAPVAKAKAVKPRGAKKKTPRRGARTAAASSSAAAAAANALTPFTAPDVAKLYDFPTGLDGAGQCIGIIELNSPNPQNRLGTGYSIADLTSYFATLGIPMPAISAVGVAGGANLPGIDPDSDVEVMLDIEVSGAVAPGATIVVYFAPNTGKGFIDVLSAAVHDSVHKPSVISVSWGGPEDVPFTTEQQRNGLEQILQDAAQLGITVCCSAGDDGSPDLPLTDAQGQPARDGKPHVDFPASSAFALACGGTTLTASGGAIAREVVWNEGDPQGPSQPSGATGGGVSNVFALPAYQASLGVPKSPTGFTGRGLPDVAGNADSATGYLVKLASIPQLVPVGGTSAVAPLWAGLLTLINQRLAALGKAPVGLVHPQLYQASATFHDITQGNNDIGGTLHVYSAGPGWDPCTGLGTPDGAKLLKALGG